MVKNNNYFLNVIQHSSIISRVMNNYELFVDALVRSKRKIALPIIYILPPRGREYDNKRRRRRLHGFNLSAESCFEIRIYRYLYGDWCGIDLLLDDNTAPGVPSSSSS